MTFTAMGFAVSTIARSTVDAALYLGYIGIARAAAVIGLSFVAGYVADAVPRRRTLAIANLVMAAMSLLLAVLASAHVLTIAWLVAISAVNGVAQTFDSPVRQSWFPLLVDRHLIGNAIGLNSVAFNAPAVIGPAAAGLLIGAFGVQWAFFIDALATLAVVGAVAMMKHAPAASRRTRSIGAEILFGFRYVVRHRVLRVVMFVTFVFSLLVRPYAQLLPAYAIKALHADAVQFGGALAAVGVGALFGAVITAAYGGRRRGWLWAACALVASLSVASLAAIWSIGAAIPVLFVTGLVVMLYQGTSNTLVQTLTPDALRGRAVAFYTMIVLGVVPAGALVVGALASIVTLHVAFAAIGALGAALALWVWFTQSAIRAV